MDALAKVSEKEDILVVFELTTKIFGPLLLARKDEIERTPKKTFAYGSHNLQQLDIYYPSPDVKHAPIMFFVHGGGFVRGSKNGLAHIGAFYAKRGILTVIVDYRLAPETQYPGASQDVYDAVNFVLSSPEAGLTDDSVDKSEIYIQGQSAGGVHVLNLFLEDSIQAGKDHIYITGMIIMAAAYEGASYFPEYFGSDPAVADSRAPLALLRSQTAKRAEAIFPGKILILRSEHEPTPLVHWDINFRDELRKKDINFHWKVMKGHNHVSPECALSSGEGEEFGEFIVKFVKS